MQWINRDKLTPFDMQVLNLLAFMPHKVALHTKDMQLPGVGNFHITWLGMQTIVPSLPSTTFRRLSWRGQILVGQEHERLLQQVVPEQEKAEADTTTAAQAGSSKMNPRAASGGLTGAGAMGGLLGMGPSLAKQMQAMQAQNLADLQRNFLSGGSTAMEMEQRARERNEQLQLMMSLPSHVLQAADLTRVARLAESLPEVQLREEKKPE